MFALGASVDLIAEVGIKNIEERALTLNRFLTTRLIDSGWKVLSPIADERTRSAETLVQADDPATLSGAACRAKNNRHEKAAGNSRGDSLLQQRRGY